MLHERNSESHGRMWYTYLHVFLHLLLLVSKFSEGVNDQTYSDIITRGWITNIKSQKVKTVCSSLRKNRLGIVRTLNNGQQDDDDEEEERDVKDHSIELVFVSSGILDLVSNTSTGTHAHVHVEQVTLRSEEEHTSCWGEVVGRWQ